MITRVPGTGAMAWINPAKDGLVRAAKNTQIYYRILKPIGLGIAIGGMSLSTVFVIVASIIPTQQAQAIGWIGSILAGVAVIGAGIFGYGLLILNSAKKQFEHALQGGEAVRTDSHTYRTLKAILYVTCGIDISTIVQATQQGSLYAKVIQPYVYSCVPLEEKRARAESDPEITAMCLQFLNHALEVAENLVSRSAQARAANIDAVKTTALLLGRLTVQLAQEDSDK